MKITCVTIINKIITIYQSIIKNKKKKISAAQFLLFYNFGFLQLFLLMKFNKGQRVGHMEPNQFVPPCNKYQPQLITSNKSVNIVTGSLLGPSLLQKNTFGYAHRFPQKQHINSPGPGTYDQSNLRDIINKASKKDKKIYKGINKLQNGIPSIPCNYYGQKQDEQQKKYVTQLKMNQNLSRSQKVTKKKSYSYSFSKSQKVATYIPKNINFVPREDFFIEEDNIQDGEFNQYQESMGKKTQILWKEKIQKSNDRRKQIINLINPQFIPSLQLIQMMNKRKTMFNPGPGAYKEQSMIKQIKGASFGNEERFKRNNSSKIGPGIYKFQQSLPASNGYTFSRSQKNLFDEKQNQIQNFRYYIDPNKQQLVHSKISQNLNPQYCCPFGSGSTRFTSLSESTKSSLSLLRQKEIPKSSNKKSIMKKIRIRQMKQQYEKDEGLLGISTMISTID